MTKKEEFMKEYGYETSTTSIGSSLRVIGDFEKCWQWIEQAIKEAERKARVDENEYWTTQAEQLVKFMDGVHWQDFQIRIKELKNG